MSSMNTPGNCWKPQSLSAVIEISTCVPAYAERSISNCCQPLELPFAAFHMPLVPVLLQSPDAASNVW